MRPDQKVSLPGDSPTQSGHANLSNGLLTGGAVGRAFSRNFPRTRYLLRPWRIGSSKHPAAPS